MMNIPPPGLPLQQLVLAQTSWLETTSFVLWFSFFAPFLPHVFNAALGKLWSSTSSEAVCLSHIHTLTGRMQWSDWEGRGCVLNWCRLWRDGKEYKRTGILEKELGKQNAQWARAAIRGDVPVLWDTRGTVSKQDCAPHRAALRCAQEVSHQNRSWFLRAEHLRCWSGRAVSRLSRPFLIALTAGGGATPFWLPVTLCYG